MSAIDLFDRPIAFQRAFVDLGVGITGALMLSQCVYWAKRSQDKSGWFYKSQQDWEEETGLNRREQERARKALRTIGVVEERRRGVPARMYFRVNEETLNDALLGSPKEVTLEEVLDTYRSTLNGLSKTGIMRAKKLGVTAEYVDYSEVLKREGMVCSCCGEQITYGPGQHPKALCFDHETPLSAGGSHSESNLKPAHVACNLAKGGAKQSSLSKQDNLSPSTQAQPSMSTQDKQERLAESNKSALIEQSITEITTETTSEITAERTSEPDRPDSIEPPSNESDQSAQEPERPDAAIQSGKHWGTAEDLELAECMWSELVDKLGEDSPRKPSMATWANSVRLMRERDNRKLVHVRVLWSWCREHKFWAANVQSPAKLREKWSQLAEQRKFERKRAQSNDVETHNREVGMSWAQRRSGSTGEVIQHER
ncbi:MAG: hypothetical protein ACI92N_002190 [Pseudomonadales bacterium]|jgi:hypothetical protein